MHPQCRATRWSGAGARVMQQDGTRRHLPWAHQSEDVRSAAVPRRAPSGMDRDEFCERVGSRLGVPPEEAEAIATTVFEVLRARISEGEVRRVEARLPEDLRSLWRPPE